MRKIKEKQKNEIKLLNTIKNLESKKPRLSRNGQVMWGTNRDWKPKLDGTTEKNS